MAREEIETIGPVAASRIGATVLVVRTFVVVDLEREPKENQEVFLAVCIWCLGDALIETD